MKRVVFGLSLALAAFGFFGSPVLVADSQHASSADQVFLASLAEQSAKGTTGGGKPPGSPVTDALCSAYASCGGSTISCTSNASTTSCSGADRNCAAGERGHVTCNGATTWCPEACFCGATVYCGNGTSVSCSSSYSNTTCSGVDRNCSADEQGHVTCDGNTYTCTNPCPLCSTTAFCGDGTTVSCESNQSPYSCSAADKSCPYEQGHVTCDGVTQWCSSSCCSINCSLGEYYCSQSCGSCPYNYTCDQVNCYDSCTCGGFRSEYCPLQLQPQY